MKRVAILGGGLSGLTAAYRLMTKGVAVTLFEAAPQLGGQLSTAREEGWIVELGAEGFVARSEAVPQLARDLGMGRPLGEGGHAAEQDRGVPWSALLDQRVTTSYRYDGTRLIALAPGEAAEALSFQVARADKGAGIRTFVGGMQSLSDALVTALTGRSELCVGMPARKVTVDDGLPCVDGARFDAVIVTTASQVAATLLEPIGERAVFSAAESLSSVTVSVGYEARQIAHPLDGTGFVVAEPFEGLRACTFASSKFCHRAPDGMALLRVFFRPTPDELDQPVDWAARAARVLRRVLPIEGAPHRAWVSIWSKALPVYSERFRQEVQDAERIFAPLGIHFAGSSFHGSGIDAAVRSANALAIRVAS
jgi:oxygen-dependent protoporphyrinogen oxidase